MSASVADNVIKGRRRSRGVRGVRVEGLRQGDWVLIDAGDVIVHVFRPGVRADSTISGKDGGPRPGDKQ